MVHFSVSSGVSGIAIQNNVPDGGSLGLVYLDNVSLRSIGVNSIPTTTSSSTTGGMQ